MKETTEVPSSRFLSVFVVLLAERAAVCYDFAMATHRLGLNADEHPFLVNSIQRDRLDREERCLLWTLYGQPARFLMVWYGMDGSLTWYI